jgi:hypothetical protein
MARFSEFCFDLDAMPEFDRMGSDVEMMRINFQRDYPL